MLIQLVIIQVITFVIIVVTLRKLLYSETAKESARLKLLRDEFSRKEKELQLKIEAAKKDAEEKIAKAEEEARRYRESKEREADDAKETIIAKARDRAEEMIKAAINSKEKIKEEIHLELKGKIPVAAVRIFKEALPEPAREIMHDELVEDVIAKVKKLEKAMFKTKTEKGELLTPIPLKKQDKEKVLSAINEKTGHMVTLTEKEDASLIAGIIIKMGALVIDGSLENKLKQMGDKLE